MASYQVTLEDGSTYEIEVADPAQPQRAEDSTFMGINFGNRDSFNTALAQNRQQVEEGQATPGSVAASMTQQRDMQAPIDIAKTMGSSIYAEPLAGLSGLAATVYDGAEAGSAVTQDVRNRLTVPMGQAGAQAVRAGVEGVPEPVRKLLTSFGKKYSGFADMAAEAYGPAAGAAIKTAPIALAELLGAKGAFQVLRRSNSALAMNKGTLGRALNEAAPSVDELKAASSALFKEIDTSGVTLNQSTTRVLAAKAKAALARVTGEQRRRAPALWREVDDLTDAVSTGQGYPVPELVRMRDQVATIAGNRTDNQAAAAGAMREALDEALDGLTAKNLTGSKSSVVGDQLKQARELWRRGKRGETIENAITQAHGAASGFENGLRVEFRKLTRHKDFKYLTKPEQRLVRDVVEGGITENTMRRMGRFGFGEGASSSLMGMGVGGAAGYAVAGPTGMVALPIIGQVSRGLAQRMTRNNARFALDVVKSGRDAQRIVASYMLHTPRSRQIPDELAQLLMNPQVDLRGLSGAGNSIISQARLQALANRAQITQLLAAQAAGAQASAQASDE